MPSSRVLLSSTDFTHLRLRQTLWSEPTAALTHAAGASWARRVIIQSGCSLRTNAVI